MSAYASLESADRKICTRRQARDRSGPAAARAAVWGAHTPQRSLLAGRTCTGLLVMPASATRECARSAKRWNVSLVTGAFLVRICHEGLPRGPGSVWVLLHDGLQKNVGARLTQHWPVAAPAAQSGSASSSG